jgi:hypothetical protein
MTSVPPAKKTIALGQNQKVSSPIPLKKKALANPLGIGAKPAVPIQLNKASLAPSTPPEEAVAEPPPSAPPAKKPIILNRKPMTVAKADSEVTPPSVGGRPDGINVTEVMDVSELSDDTALSADFIRKEKKNKRVTKFKIKGPK